MSTPLDELIQRHRHPDAQERLAARTELSKLSRSGTLSLRDAELVLRGATGEFPPVESEWQHPAIALVHAAGQIVRDKDPAALLGVVESVFADLPNAARFGALHIFTMVHTPEAARRYLRLLESHAGSFTGAPLPTYRREAGPEVASTIFPALLGVMERHPVLRSDILLALLNAREADLVPGNIAKPFHAAIASALAAGLAHARVHQRGTGLGWRDEPPYADERDFTGILLDLCGRLDSAALLKGLRSCGDLLDPRLRRFRAVSLLRRGADVPDSELGWIAESHRDRYWLFSQLRDMNMAGRLPPACRDQALLAKGAMVDWLCFGTELGREPDEISLIHKETRAKSSGPRLISWLGKRKPVDYFFFKFRVTEEHWSKEHGWQVGMAGGYPREEQPTTSHDGGTFSTFGKLDEKSIPEHVADYLE
jgi:hypothetical protein